MTTALEHKRDEKGIFNPVLPDERDWPIYKLSHDRKGFLKEYTEKSKAHLRTLLGNDEDKLEEEIARALYRERIRIKEEPWKVDPADEKSFWKKINEDLVKIAQDEGEPESKALLEKCFDKIISRYTNEIAGHFNRKIHRFARSVVPVGFNRILNTASTKRIWSTKHRIKDRIKLTGDLEKIRELCVNHTLVFVPTHSSNLDSVLIGWCINVLGIPALLYGAGLNLFNSPVFAYFMNGLGAYRVDRRKKNLLYIETLKMYSLLTLQKGCHALFFPGGTRSRSNIIENDLKLGLLGTCIEAQRQNFRNEMMAPNGQPKKIILVPLVLNYHFVFEAPALIEQYLKRKGKEKYFIDKEEFPSTKKFTEVTWKFFAARSEIILSFADPIDVFGNKLDKEGNSLDKNGKAIDISGYFKTNGKFKDDIQRDQEYTRMLGHELVRLYYKENTVMASHLLAFAAFEILNRRHSDLDLYGLLRLPEEDRIIPYRQFVEVVERLRLKLKQMEKEDKINLATHTHTEIERLINYGMSNLGVYHVQHPLIKTKEGNISSQNMNLLYFYHNRLTGYGLEKLVYVEG